MKKFRNTLLLFHVLVLFLLSVLTGCDMPADNELHGKSFDEFLNEVFLEEVQSDTLTLNYTLTEPERYGIGTGEPTLGEYTIENMQESLAKTENHLKILKSFDYETLTPEQQLTYDILLNFLEMDIVLGDYLYYSECLGPTTGIQAQLPILLAEYNFYDRDDIDMYIGLLPCVYDYFEDIAEFEREKSERGLFMKDEVADRIIEQCEAFIDNPENNFLIEYFNDKISGFEGLTENEATEYAAANRDGVLNYVIPAYELLIDTLKDLKGTGINSGGLYYFPEGQAYYEYLALSKTGSEMDIEEMADMLDEAIGNGILKITKMALSDPQLIEELEAFSSFPLTDPDEILDDLKNDIVADFPEPVPVEYEIKYIHESLSDYLSPAMYLIPAIDDYTSNNIYINSDRTDVLSRIYTTMAHEGYPGHLYQNVYFRSQDPHPIRSLMNFIGYDEGWATYVEFCSYSYAGIDEDLAGFMEANNEIVLFMYARADIGIHYEGWTKDKALEFITGFTGDDEISERIYETLLEEPSIYLPYAVGYLEILNLREKAENELGSRFSVRDFHKFLLDIGPAQYTVIDDYMDIWLGSMD
jgi:uncharacterized protein (DUF885 family)